jgi:hypothetical protein
MYQMPEFESVVEFETGLFFEYDEVDSLVLTITKWFDLGFNRDEVRKKCHKVIDTKYNPNVQLNTFRKVFNKEL